MIKVASYCRVSTDNKDQANSFEAQQRYFREYIERHPDWELYEVYADEGITGTSTKKRIQFKRMMNDAYSEKFKLIITKEVSRFSRNILDTIAYTRELKSLGIGVIFMNDGFSTLDADAELRLSIMGAIAQEESRKTSSRVKWGQTRQMERGVVFGRSLLGYDLQKGRLVVNPEGAKIISLIFRKYGVEKKGSTVIAREMQKAGFKTYSGNSAWSASHILKILKNEKYVGDLIQKKTITPDYLTHSKKYNHGEEPFIVLKDHHEPIVSRELWDLVQEEIKKRDRNNHNPTGHSNRFAFSGKIKCAECGANFVSRIKTKKDGSTYRRWGCLTAVKEGKRRLDSHGNTLGCDVGKQLHNDLVIDMVRYVIQNIPLNFAWITQNLASITTQSIQCVNSTEEDPDKLLNKIQQLETKKRNAIDAFLSGFLTDEEFQQTKKLYQTELDFLNIKLKRAVDPKGHNIAPIQSDISDRIRAVITFKTASELFMKTLLESIIVHKDGKVEIRLKQLNTIWILQLDKH